MFECNIYLPVYYMLLIRPKYETTYFNIQSTPALFYVELTFFNMQLFAELTV